MSLVRLIVLLVLIGPVWLGPAMQPLVRALGGEPDHHCVCGMTRGQCGCPECAAAEHERVREHRPSSFPIVRNTCDTDGVAPTARVIPNYAPTKLTSVEPLLRSVLMPVAFAPPPPHARDADEPPTPPPRRMHA